MNSKSIRGNKSILILAFFLLILIVLWVLPSIFKSEYLYFLWFLSAGVMSVFLIIKYKSINKQDIVIAILLGGISSLSNPFFGITAIFAFLGGQSVFRRSNNKIKVIKSGNKKDITTTILAAVVVGTVLGTINVLFMSMGTEMNPGFELKFILTAFRAGVAEDIIFRFLLFAICVHITKDKVLSKGESILCYIIMSFPHALSHVSLSNFNIVRVLVLFIIFGIPFALLQRKHDLTAAMGSHVLVDTIRFIVFRA